MRKLKDILEISTPEDKYKKVKALYDRPGTPGEKVAAKAAMDRITKEHPHIGKTDSKFEKRDFGKWNSKKSQTTKYGSKNPDNNIEHGYFVYHKHKKHPDDKEPGSGNKYYGPYNSEKDAIYRKHIIHKKYPNADHQTVFHSPYTNIWKETEYNFHHEFDKTATFHRN